ncbi:MAG TPA: sugar phosphate nucleotidyltransferase [Rhabdochlamydiaceae bacterium]|nr:sugar phosphate nucleotidyltransferase [Rhabdochlamydiaceae bacterium]
MSSKKEDYLDIVEKSATIVLAGGQGTRLFPLTATRCKPSVSFGGRYRLIDIPISNSLNAGIAQIFVISQYFAVELHQHILATYHMDQFRLSGGIELISPQDTPHGKTWFRGTADAVRQNLDFIMKNANEYFLILSGDQLYNMNLIEMIELSKKEDADLVIASLPVEEAEAKRMGLLKLDPSGRIVDFVEKPQEEKILNDFRMPKNNSHWLGSMGIYVFKRSALQAILKEEGDDFGKDLIPKFIRKSKTVAFTYKGYWEDIGTVLSYYRANLILTEKDIGLNTYDLRNPIYAAPQHVPSPLINGTLIKNSLISQGSIIEAEEITHSVIGLRCIIKKKTIIRDSILMGNRCYFPAQAGDQEMKEYSIGENCFIQKAIIDEHTHIGNNVQLTNKKKIQTMDGDGVFIRDGIIIIAPGTTLPDGYVL